MKNFIFILIGALTTGVSSTFAQPNRPVTFLHGLNSEQTTWNTLRDQLNNEFRINPNAMSYSSDITIPTIASQFNSYLNNIGGTNNVVVAHGMGGLVARESIRQRGTGTQRINGLITLGTPHMGAPIVTYAPINTNRLLALWATDFVSGPLFVSGPTAAWIGTFIINTLFQEVFPNFANTFGATKVAAQDMKPNAAFMQQINQNPSVTVPLATYFIAGIENFNTLTRLADAKVNGIESGTFIATQRAFSGLYLFWTIYALFISDDYYRAWLQTGNFDDYIQGVYWFIAAFYFYEGYITLASRMQAEWDLLITGARLPGQTSWPANDGVVPQPSQHPHYLPDRRIFAPGANHLELTKPHREVLIAIRDAFRRPDIGIQTRQP
jgi:pimeloyl-ACP methyl ester carboxylesterase